MDCACAYSSKRAGADRYPIAIGTASGTRGDDYRNATSFPQVSPLKRACHVGSEQNCDWRAGTPSAVGSALERSRESAMRDVKCCVHDCHTKWTASLMQYGEDLFLMPLRWTS